MNQVQLPKTVYATFVGPIDQMSLSRIFQNFGGAVTGKVETVHLLFQSTGGMIGDGISLYNFFIGLPLSLHIYNTGSVQSNRCLGFMGPLRQRHRHAGDHVPFPAAHACEPAH